MNGDIAPADRLSRDHRSAAVRIVAALAAAAGLAIGSYWLLNATRPDSGLVSFAFLMILPAAICAFVGWVADPWSERRLGQYLMIPVWLLLVMVVLALIILHEGVICVLILSPLWLMSGLAGAALSYKLRKRLDRDAAYCTTALILPILAMLIEPTIPLPTKVVTVSRTIEIAAPATRIWPLLRGIPDVRPNEGRWNISQDVIGVPRPIGATLVGDGVGAERLANWSRHIQFREKITEWRPGRRIGWRFIFDDLAGWRFTDRHLMPNNPYFSVLSGGYTVVPLAGGRSRVILDTDYRLTTPVNAYSVLWGELFLGDLENNLLALVKGRAERT